MGIGNPIIQVEQLTKRYGQAVGIDRINFEVNAGEIFGFLGPNGAGKTTTIRLLLDLLRPSSGKIYLFQKPLQLNSLEIRQRCGYLPGDFSVIDNMTPAEFLTFAGQLRGQHEINFENLSTRLSLQGELSRKIRYLSQGTRQKIGIIQAFLHQPELVILDEPTTGLDPLVKEEFYIFLREYRQQGKSIFLSSHNLPEVERVCDRVAIIRKGKLVAAESLENLKKNRFRRLSLTLKHPVDQLQLSGGQLISQKGLQLELLVKGEILPLLSELANLPLADFTFPEPSLEEIFLYYYRENQND
jgi:ABC-2 type transport system ATP-binding protein